MPVWDTLEDLPAAVKKNLRMASQPRWLSPMLATLTSQRFSRRGWLFEPKLDGERGLAFRRGATVEVYSRNRKLLNAKYPELVEALGSLKVERFILDGEIVALEHGVTSFSRLQQRMQIQNPSLKLRRRIPVCLYVFDLLYLDRYDLRAVPLRYRRQILQHTFKFTAPLHLTECRETEGEAYYRQACQRHWEGILAKNGDSLYLSARSRQWLKFKCSNEQEFVIAGYTDPRGQRIGFGALQVGYYERGKLKYAGKVGTGYDTATLRRLSKALADMEVSAAPFADNGLSHSGVHWVRPELVAQVAFTEWTADGKLRHPRFLGLRDDKNPREVRRER